MVDRRKDPNYEQVTGHVQRDSARRFKVFCTNHRITIAEALDQAIAAFLQQADEEVIDQLQGLKQPETFAELVKNSYFELINAGKVTPERLKELALGNKPRARELAIIAHVLNIPEELVVELRDRSFPKKKPQPKQTNGHT